MWARCSGYVAAACDSRKHRSERNDGRGGPFIRDQGGQRLDDGELLDPREDERLFPAWRAAVLR
jgi:hypothetical protein